MSKNGQDIRDAMRNIKDTSTKKSNPFKHDAIYSPEGQWKYPGQVTKIPDRNITMKDVPYPVLGVDDLGNQQMMYPEMNYTFPGDSVTEYPQVKLGGWLDQMKLGGTPSSLQQFKAKRGKTSKNIQSSINKLFLRNHTLYGYSGKNIYDHTVKYESGGGWLDNLP